MLKTNVSEAIVAIVKRVMRVVIIFNLILLSLLECQCEIPRMSGIDDHPNLIKKHRVTRSMDKFKFAGDQTNSFWLNNAKDLVNEHLMRKNNLNKAKNVILFIGDGFSHTTVGKQFINDFLKFNFYNHCHEN
jgi:hypothetical protein